MPDVSSLHPKYKIRFPQWVRQRDVLEGEDRIKEKGEAYLPRLDGQSASFTGKAEVITSYEAYKNRAVFMNSTGRTRDALVGAVMRKAPETTWPDSKKGVLKTLGHDGTSFPEICHEVLDEVIGVGRMGILADAPPVTRGVPRPYLALYFAENITDWEDAIVNDRRQPVSVTLLEKRKSQRNGEVKYLDRFRVLRLGQKGDVVPPGVPLSDRPVYFQEIWDEVETSEDPSGSTPEKQYTLSDVIVPTAPGGATLEVIPWVFFNPQTTHSSPEKPPLLDLAVVNLSHYRNSADLEHGLHFTALPQPWAAGFEFTGPMFIGSGVAWVTNEPNAKAGYLEFSGQGLGAIREQMDSKKKEMAALGARLLEEQNPSGSAEAAETVKLRHSGESSVLTRISMNVAEGLGQCLTYLGRFMGLNGIDTKPIEVKLNLDFGVEGIKPDMLTALMQQVQAGLLSWDTYFFLVKRGELIPEGVSKEDEARLIEAGRPADPNAPLVDTDPEGDPKGGTKPAPKEEAEDDEDESEDES